MSATNNCYCSVVILQVDRLRGFVSFGAHDLNLQELKILALRSAFNRRGKRSSSHCAPASMSKNQSPIKNPKAFPYVHFLLGDVFVFCLFSLMAGLESSQQSFQIRICFGINMSVSNHEAFATTKWWLNYQTNKVSMLVLNL